MDQPRYDPVAIALHWVIGVALIGQVAFGFLLDTIAPRGTPVRAGVINLHKSFGIVLGVLIAARLVWWLTHRAPPLPSSMPPWQRRVALVVHRALYLCMLVMPLSGYIASNFSKYGIKFFGTQLAPWGAELPRVYEMLNGIHVVTAFLFTTLIVLHIAAALKHALVNHDGMFSRIWPGPPLNGRALDAARDPNR